MCNLSSARLDVYSEQICATYSPSWVLQGYYRVLTVEQVVTLTDAGVEHVSRVSLEDWTQAHAEGCDSFRLSATVELDNFVATYQDCPDFNDIFIMVYLIRNVVVWYVGKVFDDTYQ